MPHPSKTPDVIEHNISWDEIVVPHTPNQQCQHYFEFIEGECRCRGCKMGLIGVVELKDGLPV